MAIYNKQILLKDRFKNALILCFVLMVVYDLTSWILGRLTGKIITIIEIIAWIGGIQFSYAILIFVIAMLPLAYFLGALSFIEIIVEWRKWRLQHKVRREFFSIRLTKIMGGHLEGYVTKRYEENGQIYYKAWVMVGGLTPMSWLKEEEDFVRTNKSVFELMLLYISGGVA